MNFTLKELTTIDQAVKMWKEQTENILQDLKEGSTLEGIYLRQLDSLNKLIKKIEDTPL